MKFYKNIVSVLFVILFFNQCVYAKKTLPPIPVNKYPDYSYEFVGKDKFEGFNRKMFIFNQKMNKYALKPIHIVWASIMPKYGMDRIQSAYTNIEYPKRLVSTLLQRDFKASGHETLRFLTNTTLGIGGLYDPAYKWFKLEPLKEDVAQGLAKCKIKQGPYLVLPFINSTSPRSVLGSLLECPLDPSMYIGSPITAAIKAGLLINRTAYAQPVIKMVESNFADPYDIAKKLWGLERYIKENNYDRKEILELALKECKELLKENEISRALNVGDEKVQFSDNLLVDDTIKGYAWFDDIDKTDVDLTNKQLIPDVILENFNPQCPVTDAMRTALFETNEDYKSIWSELSLWNRCFAKRIKTSQVNIVPNRQDYKFRYILQKDKNSPLVIIYPSIGEGISSHHSVVFAKIFYDLGYSVVIQGSHFHWEFVKSLPEGYVPGVPEYDVAYLRDITQKIIEKLEDKYECKFTDKTVIGTSFGAFATLFLAEMESKNNKLNISKYISINPPIRLLYAVNVIDKNNDEWKENPVDIKKRVALSASKIIQLTQQKNDFGSDFKLDVLPFNIDEARLITCFVLRQKLSDLLFTLENTKTSKRTDIYDMINNMSYFDYIEKYVIPQNHSSYQELDKKTSLYQISNFLLNNKNYKIYHTLDDYLVNQEQLKDLRKFAGKNLVLFDKGSHLGYLYRKEFKDILLSDIPPVKKLSVQQ